MLPFSSGTVKTYQAHFKQRQMRDALMLRQRYCQGWEQARLAADSLKKDYGVPQVFLFGSLLSPDAVHPASDIDLAVWGLSLNHYCDAVGCLLTEIKGFNIDLVRLETAQPGLKAHILQEGVEL